MINMIGDTVMYEFVYGSINNNSILTHNTDSVRLNPGGVITAYNYCYNFFEKPEVLISYMCDKYTLSEDIFQNTERTPKITQYITNTGNKVFQSVNSSYINNFDVYSKLKNIAYNSVCVLYDLGFGSLDSIEKCISILLNKNCTIIVYSKKFTECRGAHYLIIDDSDLHGDWKSYKVDNLVVVKNNKISKIYSNSTDIVEVSTSPSYSSNNTDIHAIVAGLLSGSIHNPSLLDTAEFINSILDLKLNSLDHVFIKKEDLSAKSAITKVYLGDSELDGSTLELLKEKRKENIPLHVYTNREDILLILQNFSFIDKVLLSKPKLINDTRTESIAVKQM